MRRFAEDTEDKDKRIRALATAEAIDQLNPELMNLPSVGRFFEIAGLSGWEASDLSPPLHPLRVRRETIGEKVVTLYQAAFVVAFELAPPSDDQGEYQYREYFNLFDQ